MTRWLAASILLASTVRAWAAGPDARPPSQPAPARVLDTTASAWRSLPAADKKDPWWALCRGTSYALVRSAARPVLAKGFEIEGCPNPLLLFRNVEGARPGPLGSAGLNGRDQRDKFPLTKPGEKLGIQLGEGSYQLRRVGEASGPWRLVLTAGGAETELDAGQGRPPALALRWAGDLDNDRRLDLVLEVGDTVQLYLSKTRPPGKLVARAAVAESTRTPSLREGAGVTQSARRTRP